MLPDIPVREDLALGNDEACTIVLGKTNRIANLNAKIILSTNGDISCECGAILDVAICTRLFYPERSDLTTGPDRGK